MVPNVWKSVIADFRSGVEILFASRPFWLVTETDVRSKFIEAVLGRRSKVQVRNVCTEVTLPDVRGKIDLVVEARGRTLAIEFKRWQVVVKPNGSTSTLGSLNAQWRLIRNDVKKLAPLAKSPKFSCLIVVYTQHGLSKPQAKKYKAQRGLSLQDKVTSFDVFQRKLVDKSSTINIKSRIGLPRTTLFAAPQRRSSRSACSKFCQARKLPLASGKPRSLRW